jgi:hypothetical protein
MDFICSLTGKSPSTTGFGSEGALTKGPFNALWPVVDLNNALVSFDPDRLRGIHHGGGIHRAAISRGSRQQHAGAGDLVPHARPRARSPVHDRARAISKSVEDFEFEGRTVLASRLGYRITHAVRGPFPGTHFRNARRRVSGRNAASREAGSGRSSPRAWMPSWKRSAVALNYFEDGSVDAACPPLKALLHIMAHGLECWATRFTCRGEPTRHVHQCRNTWHWNLRGAPCPHFSGTASERCRKRCWPRGGHHSGSRDHPPAGGCGLLIAVEPETRRWVVRYFVGCSGNLPPALLPRKESGAMLDVYAPV